MPLDQPLWQLLGPLLDRALELEPEGRAELLTRVRSQTPAVATALERLLGAYDHVLASSFLAADAYGTAPLQKPRDEVSNPSEKSEP